MFVRKEVNVVEETKNHAKVTTITEEDIHRCDLCENEFKRKMMRTCPICKKEVCVSCSTSSYCKECWESNTLTAEIKVEKRESMEECYGGYTSSMVRVPVIHYDEKIHNIRNKFAGRRVKVTFELLE